MEVMIHFQNFTNSTPYNNTLKTHKIHQTFPRDEKQLNVKSFSVAVGQATHRQSKGGIQTRI